jgi:hypothetical protein
MVNPTIGLVLAISVYAQLLTFNRFEHTCNPTQENLERSVYRTVPYLTGTVPYEENVDVTTIGSKIK